MVKKDQITKDTYSFIWRLVLTIVGLVVAVIFARNKEEILKEYEELRSQSPFLAWVVKWAFVVLMFITLSTIFLLMQVFYELFLKN